MLSYSEPEFSVAPVSILYASSMSLRQHHSAPRCIAAVSVGVMTKLQLMTALISIAHRSSHIYQQIIQRIYNIDCCLDTVLR